MSQKINQFMGNVSENFNELWVVCHYFMPSVSKQLWVVCSWVVIHNQLFNYLIIYLYNYLIIYLYNYLIIYLYNY